MRTEKATFTNMCMVYDGDMILVQDRKDASWPGLSFPGGHVEKEESFVDSVIREIKEETGLDIEKPELCGLKQFSTEKDGRYVVICFKTNQFKGEIMSSNEGDIFWIHRSELESYQLTTDFLAMVRLFLEDKTEFVYHLEDGKWEYELK